MVFCISLGSFNPNYKYILYSILALIIKDTLNGYNYNFSFVEVFRKGAFENFTQHSLITHIFCYIGTFFFSIILYKIEISKNQIHSLENEEKEKNLHKKELISKKFYYIHNPKKNLYFSNKTTYWILFVITLWIFEEHAILIYNILKDLDFWMIELIIVSLLNSYMFHLKIYKHQKLMFIFNLIPTVLKVCTIYLSFQDEGNLINQVSVNVTRNEINENNTFHAINITENRSTIYEYIYNNKQTGRLKKLYVIFWWIVPIGIVCYLIFIILRSYVNVKIKVFMDLKYISSNKLLMIYSIIGIIICSIACTITTFFKCEEIEKDSPLDIYDYLCIVNNIDNKKNKTRKYFDNFSVYFRGQNTNQPLLELLIIPQIIFFYINKYFDILIIKYLTPVHLIISFPVYYIFKKIILIINTLAIRHTFFDNDKQQNYKLEKFLLDLSGDITAIFGILVYLEIIELNFCNFNYDIRKKIIERGKKDVFNIKEEEEDEEMIIELPIILEDENNN